MFADVAEVTPLAVPAWGWCKIARLDLGHEVENVVRELVFVVLVRFEADRCPGLQVIVRQFFDDGMVGETLLDGHGVQDQLTTIVPR